MIDFDVRRVPDTIVLPSYVISVLLLMPAGAATGEWTTAARAFASMAVLAGICFALAVLYPHGVSFGDAKLAGVLGLYLGWISWAAVLVAAFGGLLISGLSGGAMLVTERGSRTTAVVEFAPCLIAGTLLAIFVASPLTRWYGSMLSAP
jgi:leader peptidase (prepilin peptidase)/N-methyltransferase